MKLVPDILPGFYFTESPYYPEVTTFANLPSAITYSGSKYLVLTTTGTWILGTKKDAGLYYSNGSEWTLMPSIQDYFYSSDFAIKNSNGYNLSFNISALTANRAITIPNVDLNLTDNITGTGDSVVGQIPVYTTIDNKVAGNSVLTYATDILTINGAATGELNIRYNSTASNGTVRIRNSSNNNHFLFSANGSTSARPNEIDIRNLLNSRMNFWTNNVVRSLIQADGSTEILSTYPLRFGGTGTGSDYTHNISGGAVTLGIKPRVNNVAAIQFQNATGTNILNIDTTNSRIGIGTAAPSDTLDVLGTTRLGDHTTNYTQFESDGSMLMVGTATVFDDFIVPLTSSRVGANNKPDFDETNVGFLFPQNDATEILYLIVQLPHSWKEGSDIYPHIHYKRTSAGKPTFKMTYSWFNIGAEAIAPATTLNLDAEVVTYTSGDIHQINKSASAISGSGKTLSSILAIKLFRDDNTVTGDVLAYQFDLHIEKDRLGSRQEYTK